MSDLSPNLLSLIYSGQERDASLYKMCLPDGNGSIGAWVIEQTSYLVDSHSVSILVSLFRTNKHQIQGKWDIHVIAKKSAAAITSKQANSSLKTIFIDSVRKLDH